MYESMSIRARAPACVYARTYLNCSFILDLGMGAVKRVHSTFSFQLPVRIRNLKAAPQSPDSTTKWLVHSVNEPLKLHTRNA